MQRAKIVPLHSSLGDSKTPSEKNIYIKNVMRKDTDDPLYKKEF